MTGAACGGSTSCETRSNQVQALFGIAQVRAAGLPRTDGMSRRCPVRSRGLPAAQPEVHSLLAFVPSAAGRLPAAARHPAPSLFIGRRLRLDAINRRLDHETRLRLVELFQFGRVGLTPSSRTICRCSSMSPPSSLFWREVIGAPTDSD